MYQICQVGSWEEKLTPQPEVFIHFSVEKQVSLRSAATSLLQLGNKCRYKMFQSISWNKNNFQVFKYFKFYRLSFFLLEEAHRYLMSSQPSYEREERMCPFICSYMQIWSVFLLSSLLLFLCWQAKMKLLSLLSSLFIATHIDLKFISSEVQAVEMLTSGFC